MQGLYAICDTSFSPQYSHETLAELLLEGGVKIVQLRMKDQNPKSIEEKAKKILDLKKKYEFTFILNDAVELAANLPVDGIHVGENDLPVAKVREQVGTHKLIGYSSHSLAEALQAEQAGADYVAFGAIFPTKTKGPGHPVQGLKKLQDLVKAIRVPVVAIGGIQKNNIQEVLQTGVACVAMITALTQAPNVKRATQEFVQCFTHLSF